jgi:outer membrane immunogenic protein
MMKKFLGAASLAVLALTLVQAQAADIPAYSQQQAMAPLEQAAPVYDWSGFYVGAHAGYAFGNFDVYTPSTGARSRPDGNGVFGGVQAGYNYQMNQVVLGVEADGSLGGIDGSGAPGGVPVDAELKWQSTVRARAGYAFDRFLAYGTAGVAFGQGEASSAAAKDKQTHVGYAVGGGLETAITQNVTLKTEYLYTDLNKQEYDLGGTQQNVDWDGHSLKVGANYKF